MSSYKCFKTPHLKADETKKGILYGSAQTPRERSREPSENICTHLFHNHKKVEQIYFALSLKIHPALALHPLSLSFFDNYPSKSNCL